MPYQENLTVRLHTRLSPAEYKAQANSYTLQFERLRVAEIATIKLNFISIK